MEDGAKLMKEVLKGGYKVHPVPPPNSDIIESISRANDLNKISIEKLFILG
jgi:predicted CoA-binding protein